MSGILLNTMLWSPHKFPEARGGMYDGLGGLIIIESLTQVTTSRPRGLYL